MDIYISHSKIDTQNALKFKAELKHFLNPCDIFVGEEDLGKVEDAKVIILLKTKNVRIKDLCTKEGREYKSAHDLNKSVYEVRFSEIGIMKRIFTAKNYYNWANNSDKERLVNQLIGLLGKKKPFHLYGKMVKIDIKMPTNFVTGETRISFFLNGKPFMQKNQLSNRLKVEDRLLPDVYRLEARKENSMSCFASFEVENLDKVIAIDLHEYVDLGLPSGTLWATCNVGANNPTDYGDYFAWGETTQKNEYSWDTYKWTCVGSSSFTKYNTYSSTILCSSDDAATINWGLGSRMPTLDEVKELVSGCRWTYTNDYNGSGVSGRIGKSKTNGNTIFLPNAGYRIGMVTNYTGEYGFYWSSSLYEHDSEHAYCLRLQSVNVDWFYFGFRYYGRSVRAVLE